MNNCIGCKVKDAIIYCPFIKHYGVQKCPCCLCLVKVMCNNKWCSIYIVAYLSEVHKEVKI